MRRSERTPKSYVRRRLKALSDGARHCRCPPIDHQGGTLTLTRWLGLEVDKLLAQVTCINHAGGVRAHRARIPAPDPQAVRLAVAIKRLRARFRQAAWAGVELPIAHVAVIKRLRDEGPTTASELAAAEHVTHQAITQTLAALKRTGLVRAQADPTDGRKSVISVTPAGNRLFASAIASRDAWLARAIESVVSPRERAALEQSIDLLERLAAGHAEL
jgi:DNA-binding MarR family transcriptional regulator